MSVVVIKVELGDSEAEALVAQLALPQQELGQGLTWNDESDNTIALNSIEAYRIT